MRLFHTRIPSDGLCFTHCTSIRLFSTIRIYLFTFRMCICLPSMHIYSLALPWLTSVYMYMATIIYDFLYYIMYMWRMFALSTALCNQIVRSIIMILSCVARQPTPCLHTCVFSTHMLLPWPYIWLFTYVYVFYPYAAPMDPTCDCLMPMTLMPMTTYVPSTLISLPYIIFNTIVHLSHTWLYILTWCTLIL